MDVKSIQKLRGLCKKLEEKRQRFQELTSPPKKIFSLEPDLAYVDSGSGTSVCSVDTPNSSGKNTLRCYNCN